MNDEAASFEASIEFDSLITILSKQIYETPFAFVRENVQNAVDAIRLQAFRDGKDLGDSNYKVDIKLDGKSLSVRDNGIGMSEDDLKQFFWKMGASGKRTQEAIAAGCVGTFGIGGFANFGVCERLEVISQTQNAQVGTLTSATKASLPNISKETSLVAAPRGTIVVGHLFQTANVDEVRRYIGDFVRFVAVPVYFNGELISGKASTEIEEREGMKSITSFPKVWKDGDLEISTDLFEDRSHTIFAVVNQVKLCDETYSLSGHLKFENGPLDVFKRGFKLCATQIRCTLGISGRLDCDAFIPTAGRDSLDSHTTGFLNRIILMLELVALDAILQSQDRIAQHTRAFRLVVNRSLTEKLGNVGVRLADGSESTLQSIRTRFEKGGSGVYFGVAQKQALNQMMQARGHTVVILSSDHYRQTAEKNYLEKYCGAKPFDGMIVCTEQYDELTRFEKIFLSELELNISKSYEVKNFKIIPGQLSEDLPVFVKEYKGNSALDILVDVRHKEISKLEGLGISPLLYSLISTFCREYLGPSLKKWSPRFFGDGALNLELLSQRRSELWVLLKDDIGVVRKTGQRQVVSRNDVQVLRVGRENEQANENGGSRPRILRIVDGNFESNLSGYYLRLLDSAFTAYGDLLPECSSRGIVWAGNKILYVISDALSVAFQYEVRLDEVVANEVDGELRAEGAIAITQPLQEMYNGIYFPIPSILEKFLVPIGDSEIRLDLQCDLVDMRAARQWIPNEESLN